MNILIHLNLNIPELEFLSIYFYRYRGIRTIIYSERASLIFRNTYFIYTCFFIAFFYY